MVTSQESVPGPTRPRRRRDAGRARGARGALVAVLALVLAAGGVLGVAALALAAPPAGADTVLKATALTEDAWVPGRHVTVLVTIKADRLVQGTLTVRTQAPDATRAGRLDALPTTLTPTGAIEVDQDVEVPGGSEKQFLAVLPSDFTDLNSLNMGSATLPPLTFPVELRSGDALLARDSVTVRPETGIESVGILPALGSVVQAPERVNLEPDTQKAHLVPLPVTVLDAGTAALDQLTTVIGSAADLAALTGPQRLALAQWVNRGGHLVVDADVGPIQGLPDAWQPGPGGWATAGRGDVRLSHGQAAAGAWAQVLVPSGATASTQMNSAADTLSFLPGVPMAEGLGRDAGFHLPELGALIAFLAVYVLLVGPITFLVLARANKRAWTWVCVPVLAILFTGAFTVSGARLRNTTEASHATIIEVGPSGSTAYTSALVGSVTGGRTTVELGPGWSADAADTGGRNAAKPPPLTMGPDGLEAQLHLEPGAFSLVRATGPAGLADAVVVHAEADATKVTGTVTNNLDVDLNEVVVLVGYSAQRIADAIPAHGTQAFTVERPRQGVAIDVGNNGMQSVNPMPELAAWPTTGPEIASAWGTDCGAQNNGGRCFNPADPNAGNGGNVTCDGNGCRPAESTTTAKPVVAHDATVNGEAWLDQVRRDHGRLRALGTVTAVGWTDQLDAPVHLSGGQPIHLGRTGLVAHGSITPTELTATAVRREAVRTGNENRFGGGVAIDSNGNQVSSEPRGATYRLVLPAVVGTAPMNPDDVLLRFPDTISSARIMADGGWQTYYRQPFSSGHLEIPLPAGSVRGGILLVQVDQVDFGPFNGNPQANRDWVIRPLKDGERDRLERNLAEWRTQQEALNRDQAKNPNGSNGTVTNNGVVFQGSSSTQVTTGTAVPVPPPAIIDVPTTPPPDPNAPVTTAAASPPTTGAP